MYRCLIVLLLVGCANPNVRNPDAFDASRYEPSCARQCLGQYSTCISAVGAGDNRIIANDVMLTCQANTRQCLSTCPAK